MCKPILVTWPLAMLLMDFWPLKRFGWRGDQPLPWNEWKAGLFSGLRLVPEKLPFLILAAGASFVTYQAHKEMGMTEISGVPLWLRFENAFVSYARYLKKAVWPNDLAVLYPHPGEWPDVIVITSFVLLTLISIGVLYSLRRRPYLAVGWLWFLGVLVPAIGIVQVGVQAMADRFAYLPLIGLFIAAVWAANERTLIGAFSGLWLRYAAFISLAACTVMTSHQLSFWKSSIALYEHALKVTDNNYVILNNLAYGLAISNRLDESEAYLRKALNIKKDFPEAHHQLGLVLEIKNDYDEALFHYREAARLKPEWAAPYASLGNLYFLRQQTNEAVHAFEMALQLSPEAPVTQFQLATLLMALGNVRESLEHYRVAMRLRPDWPEVLNNIAWTYATCSDARFRNGREAIHMSERACELSHRKEPVFIGTLAAAYAEAGQYENAQRAANEAIKTALAQGKTNLAIVNRNLLAGYENRRPHRQERSE
jgi:tetratricopeptide (TPR) repeat protein